MSNIFVIEIWIPLALALAFVTNYFEFLFSNNFCNVLQFVKSMKNTRTPFNCLVMKQSGILLLKNTENRRFDKTKKLDIPLCFRNSKFFCFPLLRNESG